MKSNTSWNLFLLSEDIEVTSGCANALVRSLAVFKLLKYLREIS